MIIVVVLLTTEGSYYSCLILEKIEKIACNETVYVNANTVLTLY